MVQLQLYIEGQEVEMFKDESFTLTQSIQDVRDISKIFTDFSRTFNVPASRINNKLFKHFYDFNIVGYDARKKKEATLLMNYKPFKEGKIKLEGVQLKNNEPETYKLTFYGNTVTLKDLLGEDKLSGLVNLQYFNFEYNDANIQSYLSGGKDVDFFGETITKSVIFPLITSTNRLVYDVSSANTESIKNINPASSANPKGLPLTELKPGLRLYAIIRAIEVQYPELQFSRDFFSNTNPVFYDLYLWLHNKEGRLFTEQDAQYPVSGFTVIEADGQNIPGWSGSSFKNDFNESKAKRELRVNVKPSGTAAYSLVIKKDGEEFQKFENLTGDTTNGVTSKIKNIELPQGTYTFFIETEVVSSYQVDVRVIHKVNGIFSGSRSALYRGAAEFATNKTVSIASLMPDVKIIDFITGLFKTFNLTAYQNRDKIIEVKELDKYYSDSTQIWDITKELDKKESVIDSVLPFKEIQFNYESTKSFLANNHKEITDKEWGSEHYKDGAKFDGKTYKVESPFEHFKYERLYLTDGGVVQKSTTSAGNEENTNTNIQYGYSVGKNQEPYLGEPLLFYTGTLLSNIAVRSLDDTQTVTVNNVNLPLNSQNITLFGFEGQSLNFSAELDEWTRLPNNKTLFKTYYENYIVDLMDSRKRLSNFKAFLNMEMLHNLSLADRVIVFDNMYRINKITTDFATNRSSLELTNIFEDISYQTLITVAGQTITVDLTDIFVDNIDLTADLDGGTDGFTIPDLSTEVPSDIPPNNPTPVFEDEVISVTPPKIQVRISSSNTEDEVYLKYAVTELGKLINTEQIDEYGFIYSTNEADLVSTDVDVLKAVSGVTVVPFVTTSQNKFTLPPDASTIVSGLSHPATIFFKFYGRTNTNSLFPFADVVSPIASSLTVQSATPVGNAFVWQTSFASDNGSPPSLSCGTTFATNQYAHWYFEHTGGARDLQVGDFVRTTGKVDYSGGSVHQSSFGGGLLSFPEFTGYYAPQNFINYFDFKILDENGENYMAVRVERYTGKVVRVATCP